MGERPFFVLYVLVCLEIGIFLMLVPWSAVWERNYFLQAVPALGPIVTSPWFRGAVAGLGLANIYMAFAEISLRRQSHSLLQDEPLDELELELERESESEREREREPGREHEPERSDAPDRSPRQSWAATKD